MKTQKQLSEFIENLIKNQSDPSISVAIVNADTILYEHSFGYADLDESIPATPTTKYAIASCSKAFTATAIAMLVERGLLDWDEKIKTHIPEFELFDTYASNNITVRDLLSHRSGLPRHDMAWYLNPCSREEELQRIKYLKPNISFREEWQYSNYMFLVAGQLIETISKQSWEQFIEENILNPLNMKDTSFKMDTKSKDNAKAYKQHNHAVEKIPYYDFMINKKPSLEAAGGICSTLSDLTKWLMLQLQNGKYNTNQILKEETIKELYTPQMVVNNMLPNRDEFAFSTYGLGWFVNTYREMKMIHHSGSIDGFISWISFLPKQNLGIIVLSNLDLTKLPEALTYMLYDYVLDLEKIDWIDYYKKRKDEKNKKRIQDEQSYWNLEQQNTIPTFPLNKYEGIYTNPGYGSIHIKCEKNNLHIQFQRMNIQLKHYHNDNFVGTLLDECIPIEFIIEKQTIKQVNILLEPSKNSDMIAFIKYK